jgi:hypothetical protein
MAGSGSSSWPTAKAASGGYEVDARRNPPVKTLTLQGMAERWPTARAEDAESAGMRHGRGVADTLTAVSRIVTDAWRTPQAGDSNRGPKSQRGKSSSYKDPAGRHSLVTEAANWPTPMSRDHRSGSAVKSDEELWGTKGRPLERVATSDFPSLHPDLPIPGGEPSLTPIPLPPLPSDGSISGPLLAEISALRRWSTRSGGAAGWRGTWTRRPRRQLSPRFVEWLMRWPIGWSGFGSLETGLTPWLAGMRGFISTLDTARAEHASRQGLLL